MKFDKLVHILKDDPVFESSLLFAGDVDTNNVRKQLSRWVRAGRIDQLRRGLYVLAPPYQRKQAHPFTIANRLVRGSYVSCFSALSYYGMIPEHSASITSVTVKRPGIWKTALGRYEYKHIKTEYFHNYQLVDLGNKQFTFIATREKALLDLIYLVPQSDNMAYLRELRLQIDELFDRQKFNSMIEKTQSPKLQRAASHIEEIYMVEIEGFETL